MRAHVHVYDLANFYQLPELMQIAVGHIRDRLDKGYGWHSIGVLRDLVEVIRETSAARKDGKIRNLIAQAARKSLIHALQEPLDSEQLSDLQQLFVEGSSLSNFGFDVISYFPRGAGLSEEERMMWHKVTASRRT